MHYFIALQNASGMKEHILPRIYNHFHVKDNISQVMYYSNPIPLGIVTAIVWTDHKPNIVVCDVRYK